MDKKQFQLLVESWDKECNSFSSNADNYIASPSYLSIISYGRKSLGFIINQLKMELENPTELRHWSPALEAITNHRLCISKENYGNLEKLAEAWIDDWTEGYLSGHKYVPEIDAHLTEGVYKDLVEYSQKTKTCINKAIRSFIVEGLVQFEMRQNGICVSCEEKSHPGGC